MHWLICHGFRFCRFLVYSMFILSFLVAKIRCGAPQKSIQGPLFFFQLLVQFEQIISFNSNI